MGNEYEKMVRWPTFKKDAVLTNPNERSTDKTIPKNNKHTTPPTETNQTIELTPREIFEKLVFTGKISEKPEAGEIVIPLEKLVNQLLIILQTKNIDARTKIQQAYKEIRDDIEERNLRGKALEEKIMTFAQAIQEIAEKNEINLAKLLSL